MRDRAEAVINYWFEGKTDQDQARSKENPYNKWFKGGAHVDQEIADLFSKDVTKALSGDYDHWAAEPLSCLALIVILDQFTRNIYRGTPQAYSGDARACQLSLQAVENEFPKKLTFLQTVFIYMPLMHAEDAEIQAISVQLFDKLVTRAKITCPHNAFLYENNLKYAKQHRDDIVNFGRFPYRNNILGRPSTEEEIEYLNSR